MENLILIYLPIGFMITLMGVTLHGVVKENRWNKLQAERIKSYKKQGHENN